ncbi:hypothetical protein AGRO_3655 [Agrobacterium sp. ATCC 31749]|uniref:gp53-like domain-containing protein n=1 Tax=unclassified Agrobacterium TaxID=2632611 RepID=UPI00020DB619|nr:MULTISPECIES: hypothetical protein [unclassified Agrobacterium]EGL63586.1 hypothetical protein AGRO_3655 [Agrobacterium sp. ATCC 31749]QKW97102.1 hypothetical protein GSF67_08375 [Agrobacterium sp. CGMCC 11546]
MADKELGALSPIETLLAAALFHTVQGGNSRKVTAQQIADFVNGNYPEFIRTLLTAQDADDIYAAIGAAPDAAKLGGQSPSFFASAEAVDDALADKVPTSRTIAGHALTADVTLVKADVGLGNADNTSDVDKPISTLQQAALDQKVAGPNGGVTNNFPVAFDTATGKLIKAITGAIAALHGLTPSANTFPYFTGPAAAALADLTPLARSLLDDTTGAAMYATLGATQFLGNDGFVRLPNGLMIQWGQRSAGSGVADVLFPTAFPNAAYRVIVGTDIDNNTGTDAYVNWSSLLSLTGFRLNGRFIISGGTVGPGGVVANFIAIGR